MEYNPYRVEVEQLSAEHARGRESLNQVISECHRYDRYDLASVQSKADVVKQVLPQRAANLKDLSERLQRANARMTDLGNRSSIGINPLFWFSAERKQLVQQHEEAMRDCAALMQETKDAQADHEKAREFSSQVSSSIAWYTAFDRKKANDRGATLNRRIAEIDAALPALRSKCAELDRELAPLLLDLSTQESRRSEAEGRMASAERYDGCLNRAGNSYDKRLVHEACRAELGNGSPSQVREKSRREKESAERSIAKIKKQLELVAKRQLRRINRLVFDGKNLCHDRQGTFVGLGPLAAVMRALRTDSKKIFVFDETIRTRHGLDERRIRDVLGPGAVVHIVNGTADETVLNLAPDEHDYVVSNDRFVEYRSKAPVRYGRIFTHEIVDKRVMIKDLDVSASFA